jgi:hypothetical protein
MDNEHKSRLLSFRGGDRSEYLALYFISRFAYINLVPRQEDFGLADFICFLGKEENNRNLYAENAFFVQVKSDKKLILFNEDSTNYIKENFDLPLLLIIADKANQKLQLYSSWRLWYSLILVNLNNITKIKLVPDKYTFENDKKIYEISNTSTLKIALYKPIIEIDFNDIENDIENSYNILKFWLELERLNLVALRSHKAFFYGVEDWEPNSLPQSSKNEIYYDFGPKNNNLERLTIECLTALSLTYEKESRP